MAKTSHTHKRHQVFFCILWPIIWIFTRVWYGYRTKTFRIREGKQYLILSNHQALLDPAFVLLSFSKMAYIIASDHLNSDKFFPRLLRYCFAPIYKHKAAADIKCIRTCLICHSGTLTVTDIYLMGGSYHKNLISSLKKNFFQHLSNF